jgi:hypothetical protein
MLLSLGGIVIEKFKTLAFGLLIGGFLTVALAGVSLAAVEQDRRVNGLASVAYLDNCKLESLGNLLGVELRRSPFGATRDCNAADPLDVQENVSAVALTLGGISVVSGGLLLFVTLRRPELLSEGSVKDIISKFGIKKNSLEHRIRALDQLRRDGLISESEFKTQKQKLLDEPRP